MDVSDMFIGRNVELKKLTDLYESSRFECVVIYGRRRVGKTSLIYEFVKDREAIFFTGLETDSTENLEYLSRSIMKPPFGEGASPIFSNYQEALDVVHERSLTKRLIMVIDEYPYLAESYRGISSLLQSQIDHKFKNGKLFLILCGSSMSFMENQVLGYKSPLYGRRTAQLRVSPFGFFETRHFYKGFSSEDLAGIYGITGGVPQYLALMNDSWSLAENIMRNFLDPSAYLFEEPGNLLKQEVREPGGYNAILHAIATGSSKNTEIASRVSMESSACSVYLKNLIALGIVKKETPIVEKSARKTIYTISDNMFRFWYRFVPSQMALIQNGLVGRAYEFVEREFPAFMGRVFEDMCREYLWCRNASEDLPVRFSDMGRWWGNNPIKRCEAEIDIVATNEGDAIFGECKWTNEHVSLSDLELLNERSQLLRFRSRYLFLFAKRGFTQGCRERAERMGNVTLVTFAEILQQGRV
jgi:AAA+ ATPase superfamily predicted ATPase